MSQNFTPPAPDSFTAAPAPAPARSGNIGLAILGAAVTALVAGAAYGGLMGAIEYQIGYAAAGVGFLVALVAVRLGGRNPVLPVLSAALTLAGVYAGYVLAEAIAISKDYDVTVTDLLTSEISQVHQSYTETFEPISVLFFAIGAYAAFQTARKAAA
ncbi:MULTISPECIES: hypothetical protein [Streptomyces]|nr:MULTISPECIES: hypothetical protein [Streptomyces]MCX5304233.1 hypothetical protein [Streptomyces sp. NBC_00160]